MFQQSEVQEKCYVWQLKIGEFGTSVQDALNKHSEEADGMQN